MARLDFSRLSVLLVEDSAFMRSLFINVLRALGVDRITIAEDGEQAIRILKPVQKTKSGQMVGHTGIDVVICDYFMPTVDGAMVLRWIRRSENSPDRFLPFLMVSAAADMETLVKARDNGIDEFLAKPFSAEMLASRLIALIERPRQTIFAPTYFGPDRRRRAKPVETDRRINTEDDVEIVHSAKDVASLKNSSKKIWYFRLPRSLRAKLATGTPGPDEPAFDPAVLEAAEAKIQSMEGDYSDWVAETLEHLTQEQNRAIEDMENASVHVSEIRRIAHELRGQGGIFGYPLMTQFGKSLYEHTGEDMEITPSLLDLIKAHIDLIKVVTKEKIKGDGGETGKELLTSLSEAKSKFANVRTTGNRAAKTPTG
ncbi:response regulator [Marivibrio halodurans]|uniref:Response regulator n=1 Tax=Marivibrio halodurans TaxID=2039722 RepID=A0A8J7V414_9PROT|nr:response regulator [Marivibrio halodurans]MBP5858960.1 response regulator [Marivibrio halodurans]